MGKRDLVLLFIILFVSSCGKRINEEYLNIKGEIFGTYYSITYLHPDGKDLRDELVNRWEEFDNSLSTFNKNSVISRINSNDTTVTTDDYFNEMYRVAAIVTDKTDGAFDITVAPLVNAWGFGTGDMDQVERPNVDSFLVFVGFDKIRLEKNKIIKSDARVMLDASAIAKGQACDVTAKFLEEKGCENFMVEIGGEVVCKGVNPIGEKWKIGIDMPLEDPANQNNELDTIVAISDAALATSGNYRQFYYKDGKKYAHTINPKTGFPVENSVLSTTVIAPTCIEADAYATAFMVLDVDSSLAICNATKNLSCYIIKVDEAGYYTHVFSDDFNQYLFVK